MIQAGTLFADRYELVKQLGRGGFSEVWLAKDKLTDVSVAIKIYAPGTGLDDNGIKSFTQEFALVFEMNHTNLLRPTHYDCYDRMPYLILPYCKNGSAFKFIFSEEKINEQECWKLLRDVADGLAYLHEKTPPVIHQDIKPDNILINDENRYMITDFGISTRIRSTIKRNQDQQTTGGTLAYMGPERFGANPSPIMASDVWSLGAMMYEIITGTPPYGDHGGMLQKNGAEIPVITEPFSQELKDLIYQCISLETWDRPTARQIADFARGHIIDNSAPLELKSSIKIGQETNSSNDKKKSPLKLSIYGAILIVLAVISIFLFKSDPEVKKDASSNTLTTASYDEMAHKFLNKGIDLEFIGDTLKQNALSGKEIDSLLDISYIKAYEFYHKANNYKDSILNKELLDEISTRLDSISTDLTQTYDILIKKANVMRSYNLDETIEVAIKYETRAEKIKDLVGITTDETESDNQ